MIRASLLTELLRQLKRETPNLAASAGFYGGLDLTTRKLIGGAEGKLERDELPVELTLSAELAPFDESRNWRLNADGHYEIDAPEQLFRPFAGAGLCLVKDGDDSLTLGLNVTGGASASFGELTGFVQLRVSFAGGFKLALLGGIRPTPRTTDGWEEGRVREIRAAGGF